MNLYRPLARPLVFRADAEAAHGLAIRAAEVAKRSLARLLEREGIKHVADIVGVDV